MNKHQKEYDKILLVVDIQIWRKHIPYWNSKNILPKKIYQNGILISQFGMKLYICGKICFIMEEKRLNRLKIVLAEKRKTGRDLGKELGVGELTVSRWARNARQPDLETLFKIAKILQVDVCELLDRSAAE